MKMMTEQLREIIRDFYSKLDEEDRVVLVRFIIGLIYGFIAYTMYRFNITIIVDNSYTIWFFSFIVYLTSGFIVDRVIREKTLFLLFIRGLLTFFLTWIIVAFILFDLFG
ncbi:hypothetical protein J4526_04795 [Desulfurococcaceae archaeon MEX13E-LK6-19]|nr:hypothetical protein J4526_04795 [Desulfurococcaceae archaeon MEX13E-LK6-19]